MTPAHHHQQRGGQRRVGEPIAAANAAHAIVDHDKFHAGRHSSRRPNCRGVTASALSFTPRSLDLDEISELRTRRLSGAAALILNPLHHQACKLSDAAEVVHSNRPSVSAPSRQNHRDREAVEPCSRFRGIEYPR